MAATTPVEFKVENIFPGGVGSLSSQAGPVWLPLESPIVCATGIEHFAEGSQASSLATAAPGRARAGPLQRKGIVGTRRGETAPPCRSIDASASCARDCRRLRPMRCRKRLVMISFVERCGQSRQNRVRSSRSACHGISAAIIRGLGFRNHSPRPGVGRDGACCRPEPAYAGAMGDDALSSCRPHDNSR
jgi:hypothetical protein